MSEATSGGLTLEEEAFLKRLKQQRRADFLKQMHQQLVLEQERDYFGNSCAFSWRLRGYGIGLPNEGWNAYAYPSA